MRYRIPVVFVGLVLLAVSLAGQSKTIHVPGDKPTIQQAIDSAQDFDRVLVAPGAYFESIDFRGKNLTVRSAAGPALTTIDGSRTPAAVVTFQSGESSRAVLEGFTITNGRGNPGALQLPSGGGIFCSLASPTILDNVILKNRASWGGGIYLDHSSAVIAGNTIRDNVAEAGGAGLFLESSPAFINSNRIEQNRIPGTGSGGGIHCRRSSPLISGNRILENEAGYGGGGIYCSPNASPRIDANAILDNRTLSNDDRLSNEPGGAGIYAEEFSTPIITNNVIMRNEARSSLTYGGGVALWWGGTFVLVNNIIALNRCVRGGGGIHIGYAVGTLTNNTVSGNQAGWGGGLNNRNNATTITNTIFWNNAAPSGPEITNEGGPVAIDYSDVQGGTSRISGSVTWGQHNLTADPRFAAAAAGDYHLTVNSPVRDKGDYSPPSVPAEDFEGDPIPSYRAPDIGADRFHPHLYVIGKEAPAATIQIKLVAEPGWHAYLGVSTAPAFRSPPLTVPGIAGALRLADPFFPLSPGPAPATGIATLTVTLPKTAFLLPLQGLIIDPPQARNARFTNVWTLDVK